jgi:hypothetical protein
MDEFKSYLIKTNLNPTTIKAHLRHLSLYKADLHDTEKNIIKHIKNNYNLGSQRQTITISILKYRGFYELPVTLLREYLQKAHHQALALQAERTKNLEYPTVKELQEKLNTFFTNQQYKEYCILYLLLNFQTRNMDLVATVVSNKTEINTDDNYIYLRKNDCIYIRQSYKTKERYGIKKNTITHKKFNFAVRQISELLTGTNLTYEIKKITGGYSESTIMKLSVRDNNQLNSLMQMSKNRGTNLGTIHSSYNAT